jgi:hypothetical protein
VCVYCLHHTEPIFTPGKEKWHYKFIISKILHNLKPAGEAQQNLSFVFLLYSAFTDKPEHNSYRDIIFSTSYKKGVGFIVSTKQYLTCIG